MDREMIFPGISSNSLYTTKGRSKGRMEKVAQLGAS
jgi:hypothetical protein